MKSKIISRIAFLLASAFLLVMCTKSDIEKAREAYDASQVIPKVLSVNAPTSALQTFTYPFTVTYDRAGSQWSWTAEGATVSTISEDTKTANVLFTAIPANDTALIKVTETTIGGNISPEKVIKVKVMPYCPLANGIASLVGTWSGTDGQGDDYTYNVTSITTVVNGTKLQISGLYDDVMADFWAEDIISGGSCLITINANGTLDIPEQYFCDTDYSSGYKIKGSGKWDNCGAKPKLIIDYDVWYPDGNYYITNKYKSYFGGLTYVTANITKN